MRTFDKLLAAYRWLHRVENSALERRTWWERATFDGRLGWYDRTLSSRFGAYINHRATLADDIVWRHDLLGIFIAGEATIGVNNSAYDLSNQVPVYPAYKRRPATAGT